MSINIHELKKRDIIIVTKDILLGDYIVLETGGEFSISQIYTGYPSVPSWILVKPTMTSFYKIFMSSPSYKITEDNFSRLEKVGNL